LVFARYLSSQVSLELLPAKRVKFDAATESIPNLTSGADACDKGSGLVGQSSKHESAEKTLCEDTNS